ncbi:winged helix-turn-helix domain-containing protein [Sulfodiicoccus acidiphilus]|nr:helix-turn-helix domain-containing protein [Sulfodiicoccus acidiphilus]
MDDRIFEAVSHPVRRQVILLLGERKEMTFSEIMNELSIESPALAFHMRKLEGLIEKVKDSYRLTDLGRRAYGVILSLKGVSGSTEATQKEESVEPLERKEMTPLILRDRMMVEVTQDLVDELFKEGRKLVVTDCVFVDFKEMDPGKLKEVLEEVKDVVTVTCPESLRVVVEPRCRDVLNVSDPMGKNLTFPMLGVPSFVDKVLRFALLGSPLLGSPKVEKSLREVYNTDIPQVGKLTLEMEGGTLEVREGAPHVRASCEDPDDFEISTSNDELALSFEGCNVLVTHPADVDFDLEMEGGVAELMGLSPRRANVEMDGGVGRIDLVPGEMRIAVSGGQLTGLLRFTDIRGNSKVYMDLEGGVASLALDVPEQVGIVVSVDRKGGMLYSTLKQREGIGGKVEVEAKVRGGLLELREAESGKIESRG